MYGVNSLDGKAVDEEMMPVISLLSIVILGYPSHFLDEVVIWIVKKHKWGNCG